MMDGVQSSFDNNNALTTTHAGYFLIQIHDMDHCFNMWVLNVGKPDVVQSFLHQTFVFAGV